MRARKLLAYREVARAYPTLLKKSMLDILGYILGFYPVPKEGRLDYKYNARAAKPQIFHYWGRHFVVITWNGGKTITIPAGKALNAETGRIHWPLSLLAQKYSGTSIKQNPQTGVYSKFTDTAYPHNVQKVLQNKL